MSCLWLAGVSKMYHSSHRMLHRAEDTKCFSMQSRCLAQPTRCHNMCLIVSDSDVLLNSTEDDLVSLLSKQSVFLCKVGYLLGVSLCIVGASNMCHTPHPMLYRAEDDEVVPIDFGYQTPNVYYYQSSCIPKDQLLVCDVSLPFFLDYLCHIGLIAAVTKEKGEREV